MSVFTLPNKETEVRCVEINSEFNMHFPIHQISITLLWTLLVTDRTVKYSKSSFHQTTLKFSCPAINWISSLVELCCMIFNHDKLYTYWGLKGVLFLGNHFMRKTSVLKSRWLFFIFTILKSQIVGWLQLPFITLDECVLLLFWMSCNCNENNPWPINQTHHINNTSLSNGNLTTSEPLDCQHLRYQNW